jgi:hypothetical protein
MLKGYGRLEPDQRFRHVDVIRQYVKSRKTGTCDRRNAFSAIKSFCGYHRLPLPKLPRNEISRFFRPSEVDRRRVIETHSMSSASPYKIGSLRLIAR